MAFLVKNKPEPDLKIDDKCKPFCYDSIMKKITIVLIIVFGIAILLLTILLTPKQNEQQNPLAVSTPGEAAVRHAKEMTVAGYHIDPNTVEAIQQVEINDIVLVLSLIHISEPTRLLSISYAVVCLKKNTQHTTTHTTYTHLL